MKNAIFINIRHDISGAIVVNRTFLPGRELKSGVFEHMQIVPDGKPCYCGQHGCFNAYCSTNALLSSGESLESFFQGLRRKESDKQERWHSYLHYLSLAINNLHMFTDFDIILGGTLSRYLSEEDLDLISDLVFHISAFPTNRRFIKLSRNPDFPISRGAALPYIQADPVLCKRLEDVGTAAVMPLGAPIGTNKGLVTKEMLEIIISQSNVPVVIDAGLGAPSHAAAAMEMGASAVLVNTAIAVADNPVEMAKAFKLATEAGRMAYLAGLGEKSDHAMASSPLTSFLD